MEEETVETSLDTSLCIQVLINDELSILNPSALCAIPQLTTDTTEVTPAQTYYGGDKHGEVMDKHSFPVNLATLSSL